MIRSDLSDLAAFAMVARHRSFRRAAVALGVSPSALSHALRGLEERMGVRLLHRTTRSVAPTEVGAALLLRLAPALDDIAQAVAAAGARAERPAGTLRLNAPRTACRLVLMPLLARFLDAYPEIRVEVASDDTLTDIVGEGFDAGLRIGESLALDMVAVPLGGPQRFAVVASPAYLARRGQPAEPADLADHACLRQRFPSGSLFPWELERDGIPAAVALEGPLILGDQDLIRIAALDGLGIGFVFEGYAAADLAAGRLVRLLAPWCPPFPGFHLYYPGRRQVPATLRAFLDWVRHEAGGREAPGSGLAPPSSPAAP